MRQITIPTFTHMIIHHSWSKDHDTLDWQGIITYHTSYRIDGTIVEAQEFYDRKRRNEGIRFEKPWSDVGYHYGIERIRGSWQAIVGRPLHRAGAHCRNQGMNARSIGICFIGNFDQDHPPLEAWHQAIKRVILAAILRHGIPLNHILGHREVPGVQKSCPGTNFNMVKFRDKIREALQVSAAFQ